MKLTIETPEELFKSSCLITAMRTDGDTIIVEGRQGETITSFKDSEWISGPFGFYTSDVASMTRLDKIEKIVRVFDFAQKHQGYEFMFNVYNNVFGIYCRKTKAWAV